MTEILISIIPFSIALAALIISIFSFFEKGFLFNNAYIYATKKEREAMDKKPYYRQSGISFLMIAIMFTLTGIEILLKEYWLVYVVISMAALMIIYVLVSTFSIEKKK